MNLAYYNPFDIYINKQGIDFIDNSTYYDLTDNEFNGLIGINNSSNSINFYLVNSAPYAGRAEAILSKNLVVYNSYALSPTSAHELGHCLNLWHTHHGLDCNDLGGCAEAIDGSNSASCGDFVTDTPADPCVLGQVNSNCQYTGGGGYNPDPTNIMSYGGSCRNHFTTGQAQRMRNTILGSSLLQQVIGTTCLVPVISGAEIICNNSATTYVLSNGGNSVTWNVSSNLTIQSQNSNSITVKPKSTLTNGSGFVEAILPTQTFRKDIWIGKPSTSNFKIYTIGSCYEPITRVSDSSNMEITRWKVVHNGITYYDMTVLDPLFFGLKDGESTTVYVSAQNACGWSSNKVIFIRKPTLCDCGYNNPNCDGSSGPPSPLRVEENEINIYPNPIINILNITSRNQIIENVRIFDNYSTIVHDKDYNKKEIKISTSRLDNGIYFLIITTEKEILTHKIIKQ